MAVARVPGEVTIKIGTPPLEATRVHAGLLEREQRGRWAYFSLRREALGRLAAIVEIEEVSA